MNVLLGEPEEPEHQILLSYAECADGLIQLAWNQDDSNSQALRLPLEAPSWERFFPFDPPETLLS